MRKAALLSIACLGGLGCSSATTTTAPGDAPSGTTPGAPRQTDPPSKTNDPAAPAGLTCLGQAVSIAVRGGRPFADVAVGGQTGSFLLDYATTYSTIDVTHFPAAPTSTGCDATKLGQDCSFTTFDLFGALGKVTLVTTQHTAGQAGIVGTDLLGRSPIVIDFTNERASRPTALCDDATLTAAGFAALDTSGFFEANLAKLKPLTEVDAMAAPGRTVPNVPTVPITVAGQNAIAQLDTGFSDDVVPFALNVNEAFFAKIPPSALTREASKDLTLSTCAGVSEKVEAHALANGASLQIGPRSFPQAIVFVKRTPAAAKSCGGIGTWTTPAAQIGASFLVSGAQWIFDPASARVWMSSVY